MKYYDIKQFIHLYKIRLFYIMSHYGKDTNEKCNR